ncbi:GAF and ANTAR domain-containing protein [Nocardioides marmoraquaticus]
MTTEKSADAVRTRIGELVAQRDDSPAWGDADLRAIVDLAVRLLPRCDHAGITMTTRDGVRTVTSSSDVARQGDDLQSELEQGPCVDAAEQHDVVRVVDLTAETRWRQWSPLAWSRLGVRSMLCVPMFGDQTRSGALNLYSGRPDAFDRRDLEVARAFAASSALATATVEKFEQLENAIDSRTMIGQAVGLVMAAYRIDDKAAFEMLVTISQQSNTKLSTVARRLLEQHQAGDYLTP